MSTDDIKDLVDIREMRDSDLAGLALLINLPGYRYGTLRLPYTNAEYVRQRYSNIGPSVVSLVADLKGMIVGEAGMHRHDGRQSHVASMGMGVHDDFIGKGIGRKLLDALLDVADNWWDIRRLELEVYADNAPAISLYRQKGFEDEGIKRESVFRDGRYVDAIIMARRRIPG